MANISRGNLKKESGCTKIHFPTGEDLLCLNALIQEIAILEFWRYQVIEVISVFQWRLRQRS